QLEAVVLRMARDGCSQSLQAIRRESGIGVREHQDRSRGNLCTAIPGSGYAGGRLPYDGQGIVVVPIANEIRRGVRTAVIDENDFKIWRVRLLRERSQARGQRCPIIVGADDNAEQRGCV